MNDKLLNGKGTIKYADGSVYDGHFLFGQKFDQGELIRADDTIYLEGIQNDDKPKIIDTV